MKLLGNVLLALGVVFLLSGLIILTITFYPVVKEELSYDLFRPNPNVNVGLKGKGSPKDKVVTPIDPQFGIVIPKIGANAKVIPNVDPYNSYVYQVALTHGVAQAKGSSLPGEGGNIFIFSHSSTNFYEATIYNSIFYLLTKLSKGDKVYIFFHNVKYTYVVTGIALVDPTKVDYLSSGTPQNQTLTLMTCWPPGTTYKRLLVFAKLVK